MTQITTIKYNQLSIAEQKELAANIIEEHNSIINIGMKFHSTAYGICEVIDLFFEEHHGKKIVSITYKYKGGYSTTSLWEFLQFGSMNFIFSTEEEFKNDVNALVKGEKNILEIVNEKFGGINDNSTEIMSTNKNFVIQKRDELIMKREFVASRYKQMEIILDNKKRELYKVVDDFKHQIEKVNKLIIQIELYLGVEETIEQIQVGLPAAIDDPINLRQRILYMDVEVGDPTDDGIDITNIDEFDKWLLKVHPYWKKKNYEILIPEEKCIAVFRIRKDDKEYYTSDNPFINGFFNAKMNSANMNTYIFMRNGENIYKIWSDLINITGRLFPQREELQRTFEEIQKWGNDSYSSKKADSKIYGYKLHFLMIQGIFERTSIFQKSNEINLFDYNKDNSGKVNYVYDDETTMQLPSNIPTFRTWQKKLNESIEEGTRIFFIDKGFYKDAGYSHKKDAIKRRIFKQWFINDFSYPEFAPDADLYVVYNETDLRFVGKDKSQLYIKYVSGKRWPDEHKTTRDKGYSWAIEKDEKFILNYDAISYKDMEILEYYMYTRIGREAYLSYIPLLAKVFKMKKEELAKEQLFVDLLISHSGLDNSEISRDIVMQEIEHWKIKNKWKRSLNSDDAKAYRMIMKELNKYKINEKKL